jgi:Mrp family chromosome partitioning ATPase
MSSRVISIAGAKGSPGCSFLATALARCLGASGIPTLLLDADAEGGGLASLLDVGPVGRAIDDPPIQVESRLSFAALGGADSDQLNGLELVAAARDRYRAVVVDMGHSAGPAQRQVAAASDWLLWVVVPDRTGVERADRALASGALTAASSGIVLNRIRPGCLERVDEALSGRHNVPVMARIKDDRRLADDLSDGKAIHGTRGQGRTFFELARSVHADAQLTGWRWL